MNIIKHITNRKYRFFARKVKDVTASIWEYEFKVAKSRQVREGVRQDRDRSLEAVAQIQARIGGSTDPEEMKALEMEKAVHEDNAKRYEAQMRMIDEQINGTPVNGEDAGTQGIMDTIAGLAELRLMYQDYLKRI